MNHRSSAATAPDLDAFERRRESEAQFLKKRQ
jgi:hypothetical protein